MIGRCVGRTGASLGLPARDNFYTAETVFDVTVGSDYPVLGIGIFETVLLALVCDDTRKPNWLPIGLFDLKAHKLPSEWEFGLFDGQAASGGEASDRWVALLGYPELVRDATHSDRLIERDAEALGVFFRELDKKST